MIMKGENGKWRDAARGINLDSLDELLSDDGYGRIVPIMQIDRERERIAPVDFRWVGPELAYVSDGTLRDTGIDVYGLKEQERIWIGGFNVAILDFAPFHREILVYRLNGGLSKQVNIILWRISKVMALINERLLLTAVVWALIPRTADCAINPQWSSLRPYRWIRRKASK